MSSYKANFTIAPNVIETVEQADAPAANGATIQHAAFKKAVSGLGAATTPPVNALVEIEDDFGAGAYNIDLTAAPTTWGGTQDLTGKELVALYVENLSPTNTMTIGPASSNGYDAPGIGAGHTQTIRARGALGKYEHSGGPTVGSGAKNVELTGTNGQSFRLMMIFG